MAAGVGLLPASPWTRRGRAGVAALWLGLASLVVVTGVTGVGAFVPRLASSLAAGRLSAGFLAGTSALIALGVLLPTIAVFKAALADRLTLPQRLLAKVVPVAAVLVIYAVLPLWRIAPPLPTLGTVVALTAIGVGLARWGPSLRAAAWIQRADRWFGAPVGGTDSGEGAGAPRENALLVVGILLAVIPTVTTLAVGILLGAAAQYLKARRLRQLGGLPLNVLATLALLPALWLIIVVTAAPFPALSALPEAPFSPAAELWIAPWLLVAAWSLLGLWPIRWLVPPPLLALLAGLLLVQVGAGGVPLGLSALQPWLAPVLLVSAGWGVATRRDDLLLASLAVYGALSGSGSGWLLLPFVGVTFLVLPSEFGLARHRAWLASTALVIAGPGLWFGLIGGLTSQVVYTVLAVAIVAARAHP